MMKTLLDNASKKNLTIIVLVALTFFILAVIGCSNSNIKNNENITVDNEKDSTEEETTPDLSETEPFNNETAVTSKGETTANLGIKDELSDILTDETATTPMNNSDSKKEDVTTVRNEKQTTTIKEEQTTQNVVIVPTTTEKTTTTASKPAQTTEPTTTAPIVTTPAITSGWKAEWVDEFYASYVPKHINMDIDIEPNLKASYDAICEKYLNSSWGCSAMVTELEAEYELCYCSMCNMRIESGYGEREKIRRYYFSDYDGTGWCGCETVTVSGYGSEALSKINNKITKAFATYAYINIYYDSASSTTTAYIASQGDVIAIMATPD